MSPYSKNVPRIAWLLYLFAMSPILWCMLYIVSHWMDWHPERWLPAPTTPNIIIAIGVMVLGAYLGKKFGDWADKPWRQAMDPIIQAVMKLGEFRERKERLREHYEAAQAHAQKVHEHVAAGQEVLDEMVQTAPDVALAEEIIKRHRRAN